MAANPRDKTNERNAARRGKYLANIDEERAKACERERRRRAKRPESDARESNKIRHREAQAHYREKNRLKLKTAQWQYRLAKKREAAVSRDEEEYQAFMSLELEPEERLRIDALLA